MNRASSAEDVRLLINDVDYEKDRANARHILERSHKSHESGIGLVTIFLVRSFWSCEKPSLGLPILQVQSFFSILHVYLLVPAVITICSCVCLSLLFGCLIHFALGIESYIYGDLPSSLDQRAAVGSVALTLEVCCMSHIC
jgi:hypothetical protein